MKISKTKIAIITFALCSTTSVFAADLPSRNNYNQPQVDYTQASTFSWTGFYAGVSAGYGWSKTDQSIYDHGSPGLSRSYDKDSGGLVLGVQAGYNHQLNNNFVVGAEVDVNFGELKARAGDNFNYIDTRGAIGNYDYDVGSKVKWYSTMRGRLGFLPTERLMIFGTGGLAFADVKTVTSDRAVGGGNAWSGAGSTSDIRWGWTIGAGAEYALTTNITAKVEYSYVNLSSEDNKLGAGAFSSSSSGYTVKDDPAFHVVRAGVNYKF